MQLGWLHCCKTCLKNQVKLIKVSALPLPRGLLGFFAYHFHQTNQVTWTIWHWNCNCMHKTEYLLDLLPLMQIPTLYHMAAHFIEILLTVMLNTRCLGITYKGAWCWRESYDMIFLLRTFLLAMKTSPKTQWFAVSQLFVVSLKF